MSDTTDFTARLEVSHRFGHFRVSWSLGKDRSLRDVRPTERQVTPAEAIVVAEHIGAETVEAVKRAIREDAANARQRYEGSVARQEREVEGLLRDHQAMVVAEDLAASLAPDADDSVAS